MSEEFKVGDEITWSDRGLHRGLVTYVYLDEDSKKPDMLYVVTPCNDNNSLTDDYVPIWLATKTGRHFDEIKELLNFFKDVEN